MSHRRRDVPGGLGLGLGLRTGGKSLLGGDTFSPPDVAGLTLWFDANDASTITESAGVVSDWADKSDNGFDVSNAGSATGPTYETAGSPHLLFDGSSNGFLSGSVTGIVPDQGAWAIVYDQDGVAVTFVVTLSAGTGTDVITVNDTSSVVGLFTRTAVEVPTVTIPTVNDIKAFIGDYDAIVSSVVTDQDEVTNSVALSGGTYVANPITNVSIGARGNNLVRLTGKIYEVCYYNIRPSAADKVALFEYFAEKW